jgi:hypothetical protein
MYIGICDVFETTGEKRCRRAFPPINNLLGLLEDSLAERLDDDQEQLANILSSWDATLNNISPNRLAAKEAKFAAQLKASAALVILAIVLDFGTPLLALCLKGRHRYILPFVSSSIVFAAGALAAVSMSDGIHGVVETSEHGGPAIIILFVGAALRLLSAGGACCSSSRKNNNTGRDSESARADHELAPKPGMGLAGQPETSQARKREIGFRGEDHVTTLPNPFVIKDCMANYSSQVNMWLEDELPDWSPIENWTSKLRTAAGHPEFTKNESNYADFTYVDRSQRMVRVLKNAGVPVSPHWSARTTYHLEVKSTTAGPGRNAGPFFVSDNQVARLVSCNQSSCWHLYTDKQTTDETV